jgi:F-type H+-transporting ATPase subunit c
MENTPKVTNQRNFLFFGHILETQQIRRLDFTMDVEAAKLIGAGLAMIGTIGAGLGIGVLVNGAVQGIARNPDASGNVQTNMILGIAFAEAVAIYCLVVALLILFVG